MLSFHLEQAIMLLTLGSSEIHTDLKISQLTISEEKKNALGSVQSKYFPIIEPM